MTMLRLLPRLSRDARGAAFLEFALGASLFMVLLGGIIDLGRLLVDHHTAVKGVHDAARYLARTPDPELAAFQTNARNLALYGSMAGASEDNPLRIQDWDSQANSFVVTCEASDADAGFAAWRACDGAADLQRLTIQATVPFTSILAGMSGLNDRFTYTIHHQTRHIPE